MWLIRDGESESLVWGWLASFLKQAQLFCARLSVSVLIYSQMVGFFFFCNSISPAMPWVSAFLPSAWHQVRTDTCWTKQSCSISSLMHHKGAQRTPKPDGSLSEIWSLCWLTRKDRVDKFKVQKLEKLFCFVKLFLLENFHVCEKSKCKSNARRANRS